MRENPGNSRKEPVRVRPKCSKTNHKIYLQITVDIIGFGSEEERKPVVVESQGSIQDGRGASRLKRYGYPESTSIGGWKKSVKVAAFRRLARLKPRHGSCRFSVRTAS